MAYSNLGRTRAEILPKLKKYVEGWQQYWQSNNKRFWDFTKFVCVSSLSSQQITALQAMGKPTLQFNIMESMASRLCGEFAKHSPSFEARAMDGVPASVLTPDFTAQIDVIEGYLLAMFADSTSDSLKYKIYKDLIIGGFSVVEVATRYVNSMSFEQLIECERVFDPTLCVFDPVARLSHKGDGQYTGKLVPFTVDDFKDRYGNKAADYIPTASGVTSKLQGFSWSYLNQNEDMIMVASMFCKSYREIEIVKLSNGHTVPLDHYEKLIEAWNEEAVMAVPPKILQSRKTHIETLDKYEFCEKGILNKVETNFTKHPIVFIDGNSVLVRGQEGGDGYTSTTTSDSGSDVGATIQVTKPYLMHARDVQQLMNFAGQSLAAEMENIVQHQYIAAIEGIPEDYQEAYTNPQLANVLVYNQIYDKEANIQINPPQILERRQIPGVLESTFNGANAHMQNILGSYDAILGVNDKQISGVAIQQGALQSNAAAIPYLVGFNNGLNRLAEIVVDLIPKYYTTPRTLPVVKPDGKRDYQIINKKDEPTSVFMDYDPNNLLIKVEMGVSAAVQKQVALDQIIRLTAASEEFAQFINQFGLETILDNLDIRGIDHLKEQAGKYMQMKQKQAEAASQEPNEIEVLAQTEIAKTEMETEQRREAAQLTAANKAAELALKEQENDMKFVELLSKIQSDETKNIIEREKISAENSRDAVELTMKMITDLGKEQ